MLDLQDSDSAVRMGRWGEIIIGCSSALVLGKNEVFECFGRWEEWGVVIDSSN